MLCDTCAKIPFTIFAPGAYMYHKLDDEAEYPTPTINDYAYFPHLTYTQLKNSASKPSPCQLCLVLFKDVSERWTYEMLEDQAFLFIREFKSGEGEWSRVVYCQVESGDALPLVTTEPVIIMSYVIIGQNVDTWDKVYDKNNLHWIWRFRTPESKRYISFNAQSDDKSDLVRSWIQTCLEEHPACIDGLFSQHLAAVGRDVTATGSHRSAIAERVERFNENHIREEIVEAETTTWVDEHVKKERGWGPKNGEITGVLNADLKYCKEYPIQLDNPYFLPTRMIDVGSGPGIRQPHVRTSFTGDTRYVTLSHCWGPNPEKVPRLTRETIEDKMTALPLKSLPKTFQDAIVLTRKLGLQYLWIDSLCIIQDDEEDWQKESKRMGDVYSHALCTIAAASSKDSSYGIFSPRDTSYPSPCLLTWPEDPLLNNIRGVIITSRSQDPESSESLTDYTSILISEAWLSSRAWTLQERALSRRIVHYTGQQLVWECKSVIATSSVPSQEDLPFRIDGIIQPIIWGDPDVFHNQAGMATLSDDLHNLWRGVVTDYSARHLTKAKDRLPALSGLAINFTKWIDSNYMAGLWESDILEDLLWIAWIEKRREAWNTRAGLTSESRIELPRWEGSEIVDTKTVEYLPIAYPILAKGTPRYPRRDGQDLYTYQARARVKLNCDYLYKELIKKTASNLEEKEWDKKMTQIEMDRLKMMEDWETSTKLAELESDTRNNPNSISQSSEEEIPYIAPSWSWASYPGAITWDPHGLREAYTPDDDQSVPQPLRSACLISHTIKLSGLNPYGEISPGSKLQIQGRVRHVPYGLNNAIQSGRAARFYAWTGCDESALHIQGGYLAPDSLTDEDPSDWDWEAMPSFDVLLDRAMTRNVKEKGLYALELRRGGDGRQYVLALERLMDDGCESQVYRRIGVGFVEKGVGREIYGRIGHGWMHESEGGDWFSSCGERVLTLV